MIQRRVSLWAEKYTVPAINVSYNGGICYVNLKQGHSKNAININYRGDIYHASE